MQGSFTQPTQPIETKISDSGESGADLGGGRSFLQGFHPLPTQRVPPWTILSHRYLVTDPKIFLDAP